MEERRSEITGLLTIEKIPMNYVNSTVNTIHVYDPWMEIWKNQVLPLWIMNIMNIKSNDQKGVNTSENVVYELGTIRSAKTVVPNKFVL